MTYKVLFSKNARKQLKKLDPAVARTLFRWIDRNLDGCEDPRIHGKGLTANRSSEWRYRVGKYRITAKIVDDKLIINVIKVGLRNNVYTDRK
ncbi:type II toxin-antitoxin system RelE/ParE family toxin [Pediococcus acidilactici]|uniref:type II toxin-antitoxin system RelE family toxin n=1 Tax=Pediococcus acidilactici TaxID=1254 RepID=UPI002FBE483A